MDDYPMLLKPMKQEMQTFAQKIHSNWNGDLDYVLIKLLETYSNAPLEYIVLLFNSPCNINCTKTQLHNHIQYMWEKKQVKENFVSFAIPMSMPNNIPIFPIIENNHSRFTNSWKYIDDYKYFNGWECPNNWKWSNS